MTWLLLAILTAIVIYLLHDDIAETRDEPTVTPPRDWRQPAIGGMVHYVGFAGRSLLIESPRGVEIEISGDVIPLDDCLTYLAQVDAL